jgi:phage N-6-adenine-methyltransferase
MKGRDVLFSKKSDEWETPSDLFDVLNKEFRFNIDVCANEDNKKSLVWIDKETNGLTIGWRTYYEYAVLKLHNYIPSEKPICWMNPPYSQISLWVSKAAEEAKKGVTTVALLPARTCTKWFHNFIYNKNNVEIRFIKSSLKFGESKNSAPFPSMIVIFRPDIFC